MNAKQKRSMNFVHKAGSILALFILMTCAPSGEEEVDTTTTGTAGVPLATGPVPATTTTSTPPTQPPSPSATSIFLNPGCDSDVQTYGITAMAGFFRVGVDYQVVSGKKWWNFDLASNRFIDGGADIAAAYRTAQPTDCSIRSSDGTVTRNPGCDPDVQANGITALAGLMNRGGVDQRIINGKKWWDFNPSTNTFVDGGNDIAAVFRRSSPGCTTMTADGRIPANPGCDRDVQANGITAIGEFVREGRAIQQVVYRNKWWNYDPPTNSFIGGSADIAQAYRGLQPTNCAIRTADGRVSRNPGCDVDVQSSGINGLAGFDRSTGTVDQLIIRGKKWWNFHPTTNTFLDGGGDIAEYFRRSLPDCSVTTP